jgi:hypothetical protein
MHEALLVFALIALAACTTTDLSPGNSRPPLPGSIEVNPQLTAGEKNLPGMEGLDWRTVESDVHAQQDGMLPRITIEGCLFSRRANMRISYLPEARLDGIVLRYIGVDADFQDCAQKVTNYFTDRLGPNPMLWQGARYWFGLTSEIAVKADVGSFTYGIKNSFFVSYAPVGTLGNSLRVEE